MTGHGVPVLTKGNPSKVDITLTYRPDLLKGAVTGQITGVGIHAVAGGLRDGRPGRSVDRRLARHRGRRPSITACRSRSRSPYAITDIKPAQDYVVTAEVGDNGATWRNAAGVPVITNGNPKAGVQVVVTPVIARFPEPDGGPPADRLADARLRSSRPVARAAACWRSSS